MSTWLHETKFKKKLFKSSYKTTNVFGVKERVFTLSEIIPKGSTRKPVVKSFESWQAAKSDGWVKVNGLR